MYSFYVYTETKIGKEDLLRFVQSEGATVSPEHADNWAYPIEDRRRGLAVYVGMCDDPEVPDRIAMIASKVGKLLCSGVDISVTKGSFEFAISIAARIVQRWGGIADICQVNEYTVHLAKREHLPLWMDMLDE